MGRETKIEWADNTFNPWIGCAMVHTGCKNCYAMAMLDRRMSTVEWGTGGSRKVTALGNWQKLVGWNRDAKNRGQGETVFMASHADIFEDFQFQMLDPQGVPLWESPRFNPNLIPLWYSTEEPFPDDRPVMMQWVRSRLLRYVAQFDYLTFLVLTKRPALVVDMIREAGLPSMPDNCVLGTSVSNQGTAESMIPALENAKANGGARFTFVSYEPATGPINWDACGGLLRSVDWLIVGGESTNNVGKGRQFDLDWGLAAIRAAKQAGIPVFMKQLGSNPVWHGERFESLSKRGETVTEWPEELRVQDRLIADRKGAGRVGATGKELVAGG